MGALGLLAFSAFGKTLLSTSPANQGVLGTANPGPFPTPTGQAPGTVTIGGKPGGDAWQPGNGPAKTALSLSQTGIGAATGISGAMGVHAGLGASGGFLGAATAPLLGIGIAIGVITTILGIISAHHKQALANEGKMLNTADPNMLNAMVMVAQAAIHGEIHSLQEAQAHTMQIVQDWYNQVKPIQRGTWHYTAQDFAANQTYRNSWKRGSPGVEHTQDALKSNWPPDPCNGACVIGHYFVERTAIVVQATVGEILAGRHGTMVLPEIPVHETQTGFPEIRMVY